MQDTAFYITRETVDSTENAKESQGLSHFFSEVAQTVRMKFSQVETDTWLRMRFAYIGALSCLCKMSNPAAGS